MTTTKQIVSLTVDEISLVDDPANPAALVTIIKARNGFKPCPDCKDEAACKAKGFCATAKADTADVVKRVRSALTEMAPAIVDRALAGLPADPTAAALASAIIKEHTMDLEQLSKALDDATKSIETVKAENEKLAKRNAELEAEIKKAKEPPPSEDDVMKSLPEAVRKRLEAAEKSALALEAEVTKIRTEREESEAIAKAKGLGIGDAAKLGPALLRIAKGKSTADDAKLIEETLTSAARTSNVSPLFKSVGSGAGADGNPEAVLDAKATEIQKANPKLTYAQAYDQALTANPELYDRVVKAKRG